MKIDLIWKEGTIWINIKIAYINDLNDPMVGPVMKCREHDIEIYKQEAHHWQVTSLCVLIYFCLVVDLIQWVEYFQQEIEIDNKGQAGNWYA